MSKYYKAEDVIAFLNLHCPKDMWEYQIADLPTIEVSEKVEDERCKGCKHYKLACDLFSEICKYEPITQTETQNSNLTFEKADTPKAKVSEDAISRADLIESFLADSECKREEAKACMCSLDLMLELIENAPSVVPTTEQSSKVGEWQITDAYPHNVYCSECHKKFAQTHWAVWEDGTLPRNYCPNCGAKMKGERR